METNRQRLNRLGMDDDVGTIFDIAEDAVCAICDRFIKKNLNPNNPACEGMWCEEAVELWLEEEAE